MREFYADLHIHIGRTYTGKPVKITGARSLTLENILQTASGRKGLDIIGIIDCHSPEVLEQLKDLASKGEMEELEGGGLRYESTVLIPGSEIEIYDEYCRGPVHVLAYFPNLASMELFSHWMTPRMKNISLSSQRIYCNGRQFQEKVKELGGLFVPAHIFTPFKSLFGRGVEKSLTEVFDPKLIDAVELGLSSDTDMAEGIEELDRYVFLTDSDAHSLGKIAREYQRIQLEEASFEELKLALQEEEGRKITANYGLNPALGKYHQTVCGKCFTPAEGLESCPACGSRQIIKGVASRIKELSGEAGHKHPRCRPPYIHQVPLEFIPGLGPKMYERLIAAFQTEMNILHRVPLDELIKTVPAKTAEFIDLGRQGKLEVAKGGGGKYGKISAGKTKVVE